MYILMELKILFFHPDLKNLVIKRLMLKPQISNLKPQISNLKSFTAWKTDKI